MAQLYRTPEELIALRNRFLNRTASQGLSQQSREAFPQGTQNIMEPLGIDAVFKEKRMADNKAAQELPDEIVSDTPMTKEEQQPSKINAVNDFEDITNLFIPNLSGQAALTDAITNIANLRDERPIEQTATRQEISSRPTMQPSELEQKNRAAAIGFQNQLKNIAISDRSQKAKARQIAAEISNATKRLKNDATRLKLEARRLRQSKDLRGRELDMKEIEQRFNRIADTYGGMAEAMIQSAQNPELDLEPGQKKKLMDDAFKLLNVTRNLLQNSVGAKPYSKPAPRIPEIEEE